jgi:hypothetical protein
MWHGFFDGPTLEHVACVCFEDMGLIFVEFRDLERGIHNCSEQGLIERGIA